MARVLTRGFTLAEAILALGLAVSVVLLAVALAVTALSSNQKSSDRTLAGAVGGRMMDEYVYGLPPSSDPFWSTSTFSNPVKTTTTQLGTSRFEAELFVRDASTVGSGNRLVTVNVSWGSGDVGHAGYGRQQVSLSRLIYAH